MALKKFVTFLQLFFHVQKVVVPTSSKGHHHPSSAANGKKDGGSDGNSDGSLEEISPFSNGTSAADGTSAKIPQLKTVITTEL